MASFDEFQWRIERLTALIEQKFEGNETAAGRALGYKDGAYIRQMLKGKRPISEKNLAKWRTVPKVGSWFDRPGPTSAPPPLRNRFEDPERDTGWHVMDDLDALHPDDRRAWIQELHNQAEKAREIGRAAVQKAASDAAIETRKK